MQWSHTLIKELQSLERWQAGTANTWIFVSLGLGPSLGEHLLELRANFTLMLSAAVALPDCPNPPNNQFLSWTHKFLLIYVLLGKSKSGTLRNCPSVQISVHPRECPALLGTAAPWHHQPAQGKPQGTGDIPSPTPLQGTISRGCPDWNYLHCQVHWICYPVTLATLKQPAGFQAYSHDFMKQFSVEGNTRRSWKMAVVLCEKPLL